MILDLAAKSRNNRLKRVTRAKLKLAGNVFSE
jgi:hypothetical protein